MLEPKILVTPHVTAPEGGTPMKLWAGLRPFRLNVIGGEEDAEGTRENGREREAVKVLVTLELERLEWRCSGDADRL